MNSTSLVGRPLAAMTAALVKFAEQRGVWSGPLTSSSPELARLWSSPASSTGIGVGESEALSYSPFWACVRNISEDLASLPLFFYKRLPDGGKQLLTTHKLYRLLHDEPNPEMSSMDFRETLQGHVLTWGNGYAEIVRDAAGMPRQLWPLFPDRVSVKRRYATGELYYEVMRDDGGFDVVAAEDMFHISGFSRDGINGYSVIAKAREPIGLGLATERFGGKFFGNGATFGGVISLGAGERLTPQAEKNFREQINAGHQGVDYSHKFLLLQGDAKYARLGIPPEDAQFLETRLHQVEEICRWFRMPPHKIGHLERSTNNNIEHQGIEYYADTLRPWCVRWEQAILRKLVAPSERMIQFAEHKIDGVLRGDTLARYQAYHFAIQDGWMSANDARKLENLNPIANGDVYLVPRNMIPADRLDEVIDKEVAPTPAPVVAPPAARDDQSLEELRALITDLDQRIMAKADAHAEQLEAAQKMDAAERAALRQSQIEEMGALRQEQAERQAEYQRKLESQKSEFMELNNSLANSLASRIEQHESERAEKQEELERIKTHTDALIAKRQELESSIADLHALADSLRAEHAGKLAELRAAHVTEREALAAQIAALETRTTDAAADAAVLQSELAQTKLDLAKVQATATDEAALASEWQKRAEDAAAETERAIHSIDLEMQQRAAAEAATLAMNLQIEELRAGLARELEAAHQAQKRAEADRLQALILAHRDIVSDVMAREILKETERARKNKLTPAKLKAWAEGYYLLREDQYVDSLRPAMRAFLAFIGSTADVDTCTRERIRPQLMAAVQQLRAVADGDKDEFEQTLERLLTRWERERPAQLADQIVHEEMTYVRSL